MSYLMLPLPVRSLIPTAGLLLRLVLVLRGLELVEASITPSYDHTCEQPTYQTQEVCGHSLSANNWCGQGLFQNYSCGKMESISFQCEPCPPETYQPNENRCSQCREITKCSPNEQIKESYTGKSDTVCEPRDWPVPWEDCKQYNCTVIDCSVMCPDEQITSRAPSPESTASNVTQPPCPPSCQPGSKKVGNNPTGWGFDVWSLVIGVVCGIILCGMILAIYMYHKKRWPCQRNPRGRRGNSGGSRTHDSGHGEPLQEIHSHTGLELTPEKSAVQEKQPYILTLKSAEPLDSSIEWQKKGIRISPKYITRNGPNNQILHIPSVSFDDGGEYAVVGSNFKLTAFVAVTTPGKPPFLRWPDEQVPGFEGESVTLEYKVSDCVLDVKFFKDDEQVSDNNQINEDDGVWKWKLRNLQESSSGEYHAEHQGVQSNHTKIYVTSCLSDKCLRSLAEKIESTERGPLGTELGFDSAKLSAHVNRHPQNLSQQVYTMLEEWRNMQRDIAETKVRNLGESLENIGRRDLKIWLLNEHNLNIT